MNTYKLIRLIKFTPALLALLWSPTIAHGQCFVNCVPTAGSTYDALAGATVTLINNSTLTSVVRSRDSSTLNITNYGCISSVNAGICSTLNLTNNGCITGNAFNWNFSAATVINNACGYIAGCVYTYAISTMTLTNCGTIGGRAWSCNSSTLDFTNNGIINCNIFAWSATLNLTNNGTINGQVYPRINSTAPILG